MESPPSPPRAIEPDGLFEGLKPGAILIGAVVDQLATAVLSSALLTWLAPEEIFSKDPDLRRSAIESLASDPGFLVSSLAVGLLCTVLGAYVGATRAAASQVRHGGWIAVTSAALGLVLTLLAGPASGPETPLWYQTAGWLLLLPAGLAGGLLSRSLHAARQQ